MAYTRERSKEILARILELSGEEQGETSGLLSELSDGQSELFNDNELMDNTIKSLESKIAELKEQNMELFLKTGTMLNEAEEDLERVEDEKPTFEDLFDENGELL